MAAPESRGPGADAQLDQETARWLRWDKNSLTLEAVKRLIAEDNKEELRKCFGTRMEFGTAGLRAPMGPGISRMNDLTIIQTTQGFCRYLEKQFSDQKQKGIVISFDARAHPSSGGSSKRFARLAATTFISQGIPVYLFSDITPTPFVIRALKALEQQLRPSLCLKNFLALLSRRRNEKALRKLLAFLIRKCILEF
uniref:Alpha-D-phosphohexomutase alpha/beta/alpha domain-containing protein n=1 Tax=Aotus nancymaae TaxID=37293 RepID=A0A2K5EML3_AOTNA